MKKEAVLLLGIVLVIYGCAQTAIDEGKTSSQVTGFTENAKIYER